MATPSSSCDGFVSASSRMMNVLKHRGPDDSGVWSDPEAGITLVHTRLSIVDLTVEGHQPMMSTTQRFVLTFNGEIYNFLSLKRELQAIGYVFRSRTDTEVVLAAVEQWGIDKAVSRFVGMFAFAIYDRRLRTLHLVRDRLGKKPLYVGSTGQALIFGSELKVLRACSSFESEISREALALLLRYNYIAAPFTIYRDAIKLLPGTRLTLQVGDVLPRVNDLVERLVPYWSVRSAAEAGLAEPLEVSGDKEATDRLEQILCRAVADRMIADVPLGVFLSGGIDSSVVTALAQANSAQAIDTFSIGVRAPGYDEADDARAIAGQIGTRHHELGVTPESMQAVVLELPQMFDEPFADPSAIPTYLLAKLARNQVTVALTGDGGDESFAGYNRHILVPRILRHNRHSPLALRRAIARGAVAFSPDRCRRVFNAINRMLPRTAQLPLADGRLQQRLAALLVLDDAGAMYRRLVSNWIEPAAIAQDAIEPKQPLVENARAAVFEEAAHLLMLLDSVSYLPDGVLTKVDRATMAVGLEARCPLLDHRVVEFAWTLPYGMKVRGGTGKWLVREVLARHVPRKLFERPKQGFSVPISAWLRGPLRCWADHLLNEKRLASDGFLQPVPIRQAWIEHQSGRADRGHELWSVLMFQEWRSRWL